MLSKKCEDVVTVKQKKGLMLELIYKCIIIYLVNYFFSPNICSSLFGEKLVLPKILGRKIGLYPKINRLDSPSFYIRKTIHKV